MVGEKRAFDFPILFTARLFCRICQQPTKRLAERACGSFSRKIDSEDEKMSEHLIFRLKSIGQRTVVGSFLVAGALGIGGPATAWAADAGALGAVPFEFVGTVANCGIAGSRIVTAAWLRGMGLSDSDGANDLKRPAPQDPEWTRISSRISACESECFPGSIPVGATINSINIIFDEGTDAANNDTEGVGLAVLDNILINGVFITRPGGN